MATRLGVISSNTFVETASPNVYVYLPPYKLQTEIDSFITAEVTPKGKFWGVMWENINFTGGGVVSVVTETGGDLGYSAGNKTRVQNIATNMIVTVAGRINTGAGVMLADATLRANAITAIVSHVTTYDFQGVNINFEPMASITGAVLTNFTSFITALNTALNTANPAYLLTFAGHLIWDSDVPNKEYSSLNYTGESNMAGTNYMSMTLTDLEAMGFDIVEMQAYDQFYDLGLTEFGITSPDQVRDSINFAHSRIPKSKYALIIGTYGVSMNSGADAYGENIAPNNMSRAQVTSASANFYTTAIRQNNQYLLKQIDTSVGTTTLTLANPCVLTKSAHGFSVGMTVSFTNSGGALPANIVSGTTYYVKTVPTTDTFTISATDGGTAISTLVQSQSGTHTVYRRTNIIAPDQRTIDTYYAIAKNKGVEYIGFWLAGDYYYPTTR